MKRIPLIAGNWKMHKTAHEAVEFIHALTPLIASSEPRVYIAPSFTAIEAAVHAALDSRIQIGAQNIHEAVEGAFTGEVSAGMIKAAGASFVILGHSERRTLFFETDACINLKVKRALASQLTPILCIGETLEQRENGQMDAVLEKQLYGSLDGISSTEISSIIIAYEPIWAIGTGKAATAELAQQAHSHCRSLIEQKWGEEIAEKISLLYGGSVKPDNIAALMAQADIDGVLVGGAALEVNSFAQLINY